MPIELRMPRLSDNMEKGTMVRWYRKVGDVVRAGEPIAEVETDKADVELEAEAGGVIVEIRAPEGAEVPVGEVIAILEEPKETAAPPAAEAAPASPSSGAPAEPVAAGPPPSSEAPREPEPRPPRPALHASPAAWELAQRLGVNLEEVRGTGPGGRILERDVAEHARRHGLLEGAEEPAAPDKPAAAPQPARESGAPAADRSARIRAAVAESMSRSKREIPHFYVTMDVAMDRAADLVRELREAEIAPGLTITHLVVAAAARVLTRHPLLNASWREGRVEPSPRINIGIAVATEAGLVVPVLHDADRLSLVEVARRTRDLVDRVRQGKAAGDDLVGGTFTVSNLGMFGVDEFAAIINPPQAAILASGAVRERPVVRDGKIVVGRTMRATLSCDHRVADGEAAARFLADLAGLIAHPSLLLTE